jgi:transcriptional regulator with XRE-family HTH domain
MKRKNIVGGNLKRIRTEMELTQEEVALRSELSQGYINQLESGKRMYTQKSLEQIADSLKIPISDFFHQEERSVGVREYKVEYKRKKPPTKKEVLALFNNLPPRLKEHYYSLMTLEKELWGKRQV